MHKSDDPRAAWAASALSPAAVDDLRGRELFEGVDPVALAAIAKHSAIRKLGGREQLHLIRDEVALVFVIVSGYVSIWANSQFTSEGETFLAWRGPGQIIGEMKAVADTPAEARVITCEPCEFIEMRSDNFTDVAGGSARIYRNLARLLVKKMEHERCRSEIIRMTPVRRQVAQTLLHLAHERCGRDGLGRLSQIDIPGVIHQDEVAGYVGVKRETVSRELSGLKKKNIIAYPKSTKGSEIKILDVEALRLRALGGADG
ncbi:MAG: Crp/Fnr family transcriptional regulator [Acidobacteriota bacterium]|nr:Crp/Fnr family transcriptional regulator [Acidobacteriota bacterium]